MLLVFAFALVLLTLLVWVAASAADEQDQRERRRRRVAHEKVAREVRRRYENLMLKSLAALIF
jgi:hypothetical protein